MLNFDKNANIKSNSLKYKVADMCCEWCYKTLVEALFNVPSIKSVNSNFKFNEPAFNIEFTIEYDDTIDANKIIKLIEDNI